jgi:hypothetical protein
MRKSQTHFEQIPIQKVKNAIEANSEIQIGSGAPRSQQSLLRCRICRKPVPVEIAKTDGEGQAIHEDCYLLVMKPEVATSRTRLAGM